MSFDEYAQHMAQKYRLAISIALLNIKPKDLSIDQFLDQIKNIINERNAKDNIDNLSACSDDFNVNSSDEINRDLNCMNQKASHDIDNDSNYMNQNRLSHSNLIGKNDLANEIIDESQVNNAATKDEGITFDDSTQFNDKGIEGYANTTQAYNKDLDSNANNILDNSIVSDVNKQRKEKFRELIKVLKGDDVVATNKVMNNSQRMFQDITKTLDPMDTDLTQCYDYDITDSIGLFNHFDKDFELNRQNQFESKGNKSNDKDYTHTTNTYEKENTEGIRKRLNDNQLCDRESKLTKNVHYITENTKEIINTTKNNENYINIYDLSNYENNNTRDIINDSKKDVSEPKLAEKVIDTNAAETKLANKSSNVNLKATIHKVQNQIDPVFINIDTQETMIYTDTQMNTHYSPSQMDDVLIDKQFIYGNKNIENSKKNVSNMNSHNYHKENKTDENKEISEYLVNAHNQYESYQNFIEKDAALQDNPHKNNEINFIENNTALSNMDTNTFKTFPNSNAVFENCAIFDKTTNTTDDTCAVLTHTEESCTVFDKTSIDRNKDDIDADLTDGEEKIPFKIIEEINKIKVYLRRKESKDISCSYKSSQTKSSFGGTPLNQWIGQSASNIFSYLSNCCLVTSTQHLIEQISEILGQLIDRLHEEETYPAFLEEMLTTVDNTLQLLYEEENYVFDVLLKKDEQIQRILLLNKSTHVQKFTIEKINNILQKLLDDLSADDTTIEIQSINKIENLCYIFQILQNLLPKYNINSQSSQNSQDEKVLRKKDITDIWRKKWIDQKIEANEGSFDNKCVLRECSAILNKIIISFMDGYSLIAYSALKCFNIMQS